jgi:hypothetical protein
MPLIRIEFSTFENVTVEKDLRAIEDFIKDKLDLELESFSAHILFVSDGYSRGE